MGTKENALENFEIHEKSLEIFETPGDSLGLIWTSPGILRIPGDFLKILETPEDPLGLLWTTWGILNILNDFRSLYGLL